MSFAQNGPQPKRVVYFHDSHGFGGMELYMFRLIRHLDRTRYTPAVLIPGFSDRFRSSSPKVIQAIKATEIPLLQPSPTKDNDWRGILSELVETKRLLKSFGAHIVHIHTCRPQGARKIVVAARLAGIPAILRTEHFPPSVTMTRSTRYLVKPIDWLTDYIVTGSEGDRQEQIQLLKRSPDKVFCSYNSVEIEKYNPQHDVRAAKIRLNLDPELPVIANVGRFVPQKGQSYLIEAMAQVIRQYGPVNLLLVGGGELQPELSAQAERLGIASFVHFIDFQEDVTPYMQAADLAAMPSLYEVFSLAMLEFMALGKPIVAFDHSSFREAFEDNRYGLIVPEKDSQALAQAILKLLRDPNLRQRYGKAALTRVRANFSFKRLVNDMMDLYDRCLSSKGLKYSYQERERETSR
jgi:glycosyltransferase involved in cell wall biosynthesis